MFLLTLCIDCSLGRVQPSDLSEQTRMELLIGGFEESLRCQIQGRYVSNMCRWSGVKCFGTGSVARITWEMLGIAGPMDLQLLPEELRALVLYGNKLSGPLHLADLPRLITDVYLGSNQFASALQLADLPATTSKFFVQNNMLHGTLDLTALPQSITQMALEMNQFSGTIDLSSLPRTLESLSLGANCLTGSPCVNGLPNSLRLLELKGNNFDAIVCDRLPGCVKIEQRHYREEWFAQ